jgi:kinesin family member 13
MSDSSVKVAVRVRPFNSREKQEGAELCVSMQGNATTIHNKSTGFNKKFIFDYSYWSHDDFTEDPETGLFVKSSNNSMYADQIKVFNDIGIGVLNNAWEGYHCCLFAYGQTGSGKSYSMVGYGKNIGIIPITCETIFQQITERENSNIEYTITASMLEIYNEQVQDLLVHPSKRVQGGLKIREDPKKGIFVENLTQQNCMSYEEIDHLIETGNKHRTVAATNMNATSSRAHTVLTITFSQIFYEESTGKPLNRKQSNINLVDLAGSERAGKTGATGDRLQEGSSINKSLSTLGKVITTLAKKSAGQLGKNEVIPYRESKLTRILQNALGGNSKTTMIAAISPATFNFEESLSTLRYADAVKSIRNQAVVNETPQEKLIRELKEENEKLKAMLENKLKDGSQGMTEEARSAYEKEMEALRRAKEDIEKNWQMKLRSSGIRATMLPMLAHQINMAKNPNAPYLSNLNEDPLLSGYLKYYLKKGINKLGKKNPSNPPDMVIEGLGIGLDHCVIIYENDESKLIPSQDPSHKTMRNGKLVEKLVVLEHQDRIRFGNHNFFLFLDPEELSNEKIDWEYAVKESNKDQVQGLLGENNEEVIKREQELKLKIQKEWEEIRKKMEEEKEQLQKLLKEKGDTASSLAEKEKELMLRHQEMEKEIAHKQKMLRQQEDTRAGLQKLTELLSYAIQEINEANERAVLLDKKVCFQPDLYREGSSTGLSGTTVRIKVVYPDLDEDFPIYWSVDKLEERLVDMREIFNQLEFGIDPHSISLEYDPFTDLVDNLQQTYQLIGNSYVYLDTIFYVMSIDEDFIPIINNQGKNKGCLKLSIKLTVDKKYEECDSLKEIIGQNLDLAVNIVQALDIPENLSTNIYCQYNLLNSEIFRTPSCNEISTNPAIDYVHVHSFIVTEEIINMINSQALIISVYGDINQDKKLRGLSVLRDQANNRSIKTAGNIKKFRSFEEEVFSNTIGKDDSVSQKALSYDREQELEPINYSLHKQLTSMNNSLSMDTSQMKSIIKAQREEILKLKQQNKKIQEEAYLITKNSENEVLSGSKKPELKVVRVENVREKSCACIIN